MVTIEFEVPGWLNVQSTTGILLNDIPEHEKNETYAYVDNGWLEMPGYAVINGWHSVRKV